MPDDSSIFLAGTLFDDKGGWTADSQFIEQTGSSYLLAHGLGNPVADAVTEFKVERHGEYHIYIRTRNWIAGWSDANSPGVFSANIDGKALPHLFGNASTDWDWEYGGSLMLEHGRHLIKIHDLYGFDARFDSVLLTTSDKKPDGSTEGIRALRKKYLSSANEEKDAGHFGLVVAGAGCAGMCAALSAARDGVKVALIQDRDVLGGNNSSEVRVGLGGRLNIGKYPSLGYLLNEFGPSAKGNARPQEIYEDDKKMDIILKEKNITLFLGYKVSGAEVINGRIVSVSAERVDDYSRIRIGGDLFADCTGDGTLGVLAGADWAMGREAASVYGEPSAPEKSDGQTLGASLQWYCVEEDGPQEFPDIDWGLRISEGTAQKVRRGQWYWEVGMLDDQIAEAEMIRDYGMYVAYSNWSFVKNHASYREEYSKSRLAWVCHVLGKRESRRLLGPVVLTERDLREFRTYPDGCVSTSWYIDDHKPDPYNAAHFKDPWLSIGCLTPLDYYPIPFRCFFSRSVCNLFMAGRDISVSHLALGTTRVMRTCAMVGEVVGMAAGICFRHGILPGDVYPGHWEELDRMMSKGAGDPTLPYVQTYTLVDTTAERSENC